MKAKPVEAAELEAAVSEAARLLTVAAGDAKFGKQNLADIVRIMGMLVRLLRLEEAS